MVMVGDVKYLAIITAIFLLTACTPELTATQAPAPAVPEDSLQAIPEERIPLSPTSANELITKQQLEACEERDQLKADAIVLREEQAVLFAQAKKQQATLDRTNAELQATSNKLESSLLSAEQRADLTKKKKALQAQLNQEYDQLRETNKRLKTISEELVGKERDAEFLRFRCADLQ